MLNINIIDMLVDTYRKRAKKNEKYIHTQKYTLHDYFSELIKFVRNSVYWRRYDGKIKGRTLNNKFNEFVKLDIFNETYKEILKIYMQTGSADKLKYQSTDTLFVKNKGFVFKKYQSEFGKSVGRNKFYKNKRGLKISVIVDQNRVPISCLCEFGNVNDAKLFPKTLDKVLCDTKTEKYVDSNRYMQHFLGDKAYDSKSIRSLLESKSYNPIIDVNNRNTKNITKKRCMKKKYKKIYKKRTVVENYFSNATAYPKLNMITEKTIESFFNVFMLINIIYVSKKVS